MNTYPSYAQEVDTVWGPIENVIPTVTRNGAVLAQRFGAGTSYQGQIRHTHLTAADKAALMAFYAANKVLEFSILVQAEGVTYSARFTDEPQWEPLPGAYWAATVPMLGWA